MKILSLLLAFCERGIPRLPMDSPHKGQWRGALMFSLICAWTNGWANNRDPGDLRRHRAHYDATVINSDIFIQAKDVFCLSPLCSGAVIVLGRSANQPRSWQWIIAWRDLAGTGDCQYQELCRESAKWPAYAVWETWRISQVGSGLCVNIYIYINRQISDIQRTKSQTLNGSCPLLQLSLCNPLQSCVKSKMKM